MNNYDKVKWSVMKGGIQYRWNNRNKQIETILCCYREKDDNHVKVLTYDL